MCVSNVCRSCCSGSWLCHLFFRISVEIFFPQWVLKCLYLATPIASHVFSQILLVFPVIFLLGKLHRTQWPADRGDAAPAGARGGEALELHAGVPNRVCIADTRCRFDSFSEQHPRAFAESSSQRLKSLRHSPRRPLLHYPSSNGERVVWRTAGRGPTAHQYGV